MPYPLKQLQHDLKCMEGPRLKLSMHQRLQSAWHAHDGPLFEAIAIELDQAACRWINVQLVTEVIGLGPVVAPNTPVMGGTTLLGCHLTT
jgi:hypothetical protein